MPLEQLKPLLLCLYFYNLCNPKSSLLLTIRKFFSNELLLSCLESNYVCLHYNDYVIICEIINTDSYSVVRLDVFSFDDIPLLQLAYYRIVTSKKPGSINLVLLLVINLDLPFESLTWKS